MRFFDAVSSVSNEDMQGLWAKVLAGEIQQQGQFSLRTIEALRNMTPLEAKQLANSYSFSISDVSYMRDMDIIDWRERSANRFPMFEKPPIITDGDGKEIHLTLGPRNYDPSTLQDSEMVEYLTQERTVNLQNENLCFVMGDLALLVKQVEGDKPYYFSYSFFKYRQAARQLYSVAEFEPYYDQLLKLGRDWSYDVDNSIKISVHKIVNAKERNRRELILDFSRDILND